MVWKSQTIDLVSSASIVHCRLSMHRGPAGYPAGLLYCNMERMAKPMKQGKTLQALGKELQRQRAVRKDFLADTRSLQMTTNGNASLLYMTVGKEQKEFKVGELAHQQIASRLQIPYRYYQKMQREFPDLLDENVNGWFDQNPERRMIRTLDGHVRAFLSDRYRRLDNLELCAAVLPVIQEMKGASIESCDVTETHMYLKVVNKKMKAEVAVGDVVLAGFVISNSEVGLGSLRVEPLVFRLVCKNGLICKDYSQKRYHVGRQAAASEDDAYELYSDETLRQGKVYYYSVEPRNTAAEPPADGIGHKTAFRDTYGVTGSMPQPEFTVSTGESSIKLTLSNRPAYCYTNVNAERWVYTPSYTKKPSASKGTPSQPATWIQTLQFKNRWTRSKKESVAVEKSTDAVIVDSSSVFGYNDYTVYYGFDIPEISFSAHSEASGKKSGYRQISNEEFLINALRVIDFSQSYLTRIHEPGTGAAGFDSVSMNGYNGWSSGNCGGAGGKCEDKKEAPNKGCFHYWAQLGMGEVTVPLMYNDFEAFDMIFNSIGTGHQTKVNLSANGTLTGYINITGLYSGKLTFNLTITDSVKAGGTYTVQQAGKAAENLSWNADEKYFNK